MRLVLLRHAVAEDRYVFHMNSDGAPDSQRPLTRDGIKKMRASGRGLLKALGHDIQRVVSSPYTRARETAELLIEAMDENRRTELELSDLLTPGCSYQSIRDWLQDESGTVVLVGHEPDMSWLMQQFTGGGQMQTLKFGKAGACMIWFERNPGNSYGILHWFMSPAVLRQLGGM